MIRLFNSFFGRLYGALFVAIIASLLLTILIIEQWDSQEGDEDFVKDSVYISNILEQNRSKTGESAEQFYSSLISELYPFAIRWIQNDQGYCESCTLFAQHDKKMFYKLPDGRLSLALSIADEAGFLVVQDHNENVHHTYEEPIHIEDVTISLLCLLIVIAAAIALYRPLSRLESNILELNQVAQKLGNGDLSARANLPAAPPLTELVQQLNTMALALDNKFTESQIFAQAVPHEMRTPLSRIQLAIGLLRKYSLQKEQLELIDNIDNYIDDLDSLCSQILQLSKLNMFANNFVEVKINLMDFITSRLLTISHNKKIKMVVDCEETLIIKTSNVNLRLVVDNLLNNAAKYADKMVVVTAKQHEQFIQIVVQDDGIGIPEHEQENVFVPFARVDKSRNRRTGGLGLGLSIAKAAAQAIGANISVENIRPKGTSFKVEFLKSR